MQRAFALIAEKWLPKTARLGGQSGAVGRLAYLVFPSLSVEMA